MEDLTPNDDGLPNEVNYFEAALYLGHSGTTRVQHLLRVGILARGTTSKTITRESLLIYAVGRRQPNTDALWYKVQLTQEQSAVLNNPLDYATSQVMEALEGLAFERLHKYDDAAKERRRRREFKDAGVLQGRLPEGFKHD